MTTGLGAEIIQSYPFNAAPAHVTDFNARAGDKLDIRAVLGGSYWAGMDLGDFVDVRVEGGATIVSVNEYGWGNFVDAAVLQGVRMSTLEALEPRLKTQVRVRADALLVGGSEISRCRGAPLCNRRCALPLANLHFNAFRTPKFHLVGLNGSADIAGTISFETRTCVVLGVDREANVIKARPLSRQVQWQDSEIDSAV